MPLRDARQRRACLKCLDDPACLGSVRRVCTHSSSPPINKGLLETSPSPHVGGQGACPRAGHRLPGCSGQSHVRPATVAPPRERESPASARFIAMDPLARLGLRAARNRAVRDRQSGRRLGSRRRQNPGAADTAQLLIKACPDCRLTTPWQRRENQTLFKPCHRDRADVGIDRRSASSAGIAPARRCRLDGRAGDDEEPRDRGGVVGPLDESERGMPNRWHHHRGSGGDRGCRYEPPERAEDARFTGPLQA